jgi:hypothetical protein
MKIVDAISVAELQEMTQKMYGTLVVDRQLDAYFMQYAIAAQATR